MIVKFIKFIVNPEIRFDYLTVLGLHNWMSDKHFLKRIWKIKFGTELDFDNPKTFNEKLQWLKLNDRKRIYTTMVDKAEAKKYVANKIGEEYIIPTIGVYNKFNEIDFDSLPNQFVMKCTHDSNGLVIIKDKEKINRKMIKKKINKCLKRNYYYAGREWPYKDVKPRIIIEKYMKDYYDDLKDYKFFVFNGRVRCFKVDYNRFTNHQANYYDRDAKLLKFGEAICPPDYDMNIEMPKSLKRMITLAEKLAGDNVFMRVDFYDVSGRVYFGEITFFPASGFGKFIPERWDRLLGNWLDLDNAGEGK